MENFTDKKEATGDDIITVSKYVMNKHIHKAKALVALNEQKRQNDIKLNFADRKLSELGSGSGREEREIIIVVDRENGRGGSVRLELPGERRHLEARIQAPRRQEQ